MRPPDVARLPRIVTPPPIATPPIVPPTEPSFSPEPPPAPVATTARWSARVTRATGRAPAAGTPCRIEAALTRSGGSIKVTAVAVRCGNARVYDSDDALEGMSMQSSGAEERGGERPGTSVYALQYHDTGTRSGTRSQASIDTLAGSAAV